MYISCVTSSCVHFVLFCTRFCTWSSDGLKDTVGTLLEALLRLSHKPDALKDLGAAAKKYNRDLFFFLLFIIYYYYCFSLDKSGSQIRSVQNYILYSFLIRLCVNKLFIFKQKK